MIQFWRFAGAWLLAAVMCCRALVPLGYMPGSPGSGLLFELCPDQVPVAFAAALRGHAHAGHHHHHDETSGADACDLGHLFSASVVDDGIVDFNIAGVPAVQIVQSSGLSLRQARLQTPPSRGPPLTI